jgi:Macrocin-O-methyltransferase (TylF)
MNLISRAASVVRPLLSRTFGLRAYLTAVETIRRSLPNRPLYLDAGYAILNRDAIRRALVMGVEGLNEAELRQACERYLAPNRIKTFKGWFKETLPTLPADVRFGMIHIDVDLYQSTFDVLDYLFAYNHVADGCAIYFDDWNLNRASPKYGQRSAWAEVVEKYKIKSSEGIDYGIAAKRFTIHLA